MTTDAATARTAGRTAADLATAVHEAGLVVLSQADWPESTQDTTAPSLPGFIGSSFSPLVAEVGTRCLSRGYGQAPADPASTARPTAIVLSSALGDRAGAVAVAHAGDAGPRVGPLLFFQSVPNAVAGLLASRWGLRGPVVCLSTPEPAVSLAAQLIEDGDASQVLLIVAEQADPDADSSDAGRDRAAAVLVTGRDDEGEN